MCSSDRRCPAFAGGQQRLSIYLLEIFRGIDLDSSPSRGSYFWPKRFGCHNRLLQVAGGDCLITIVSLGALCSLCERPGSRAS